MNLTIAELADLPLAAAALDRDGQLIAQTPEWQGAGPGSVSYPVRGNRLVVAIDRPEQECQAVLDRLLDGLDATAAWARTPHAERIAMLAGSLRVVAGAPVLTEGTAHDAISHALAGISVRTGLDVQIDLGAPLPVRGPEVAALVLIQLAANAERHEQVTSVAISHGAGIFDVAWRGSAETSAVTTTRQHHRRRGWGLGFARLAADTLGGAVYAPAPRPDGMVAATFELGLRRLALPLAMLQDGRVVKATRSWDEETGHHPGTRIGPAGRLAAAAGAALAAPGEIAVTDGVWARARRDRLWLAIPPDGIVERARDVLDGIAHERALWEGVPEPGRSRVFALASLLGAQLGNPLPRVPAHAWNRRCGDLCAAFGITEAVPRCDGIGAVDPRIVAYLAGEFGAGFRIRGEQIDLRVRPDRLDDPVIRALRPDQGVLRLT